VEQALNTLTSSNPSINIASAVGTFCGGGTFANLRGLGNGRTLVLLDGERRLQPAVHGKLQQATGTPGDPAGIFRLRKIQTLNPAFRWQHNVSVKPMEQLTVLFGIKNLFNTSPPFRNASQKQLYVGV
jgi:hypothetical protein